MSATFGGGGLCAGESWAATEGVAKAGINKKNINILFIRYLRSFNTAI
jgi:hypothetical protein